MILEVDIVLCINKKADTPLYYLSRNLWYIIDNLNNLRVCTQIQYTLTFEDSLYHPGVLSTFEDSLYHPGVFLENQDIYVIK